MPLVVTHLACLISKIRFIIKVILLAPMVYTLSESSLEVFRIIAKYTMTIFMAFTEVSK